MNLTETELLAEAKKLLLYFLPALFSAVEAELASIPEIAPAASAIDAGLGLAQAALIDLVSGRSSGEIRRDLDSGIADIVEDMKFGKGGVRE